MNWLLKRFRLIISVALILSTVITYLIVYLPRDRALESYALENYVHVVQATEQSFLHNFHNLLDSVRNLSNLDRLREQVWSYREGRITAQTLRANTQDIFTELVQALPCIIGAFRFADNMQIGSYGTPKLDKLTPAEGVTEFTYEFDHRLLELIVYSPIYNSDIVIGYDVVFFDLSGLFQQLRTGNYLYELKPLYGDRSDSVSYTTRKINDIVLLDTGNSIIYRNRIKESDVYFQASANKRDLFASIRRISVLSLITALVCNITILLLTNFTVIRLAQYRLSVTERRKELYKEYAYRDTLTGAYSRLYFERWLRAKIDKSGFIHEDICVVMMDINKYKSINDKFGHVIGDKTLQHVAEVIIRTIGDGNLAVRYGGDEFLIVLLNTPYSEAERIMAKINSQLSDINEFGFGLSISYGIEQISSYIEIYKAIEKADEKMYISKNAHQELMWF
ncbi:MAG: GGDEF domain-containing protein [Clostridiales bacterium]|nr:GGDEF domain-containing protein [Clostridiales bacterium]